MKMLMQQAKAKQENQILKTNQFLVLKQKQMEEKKRKKPINLKNNPLLD